MNTQSTPNAVVDDIKKVAVVTQTPVAFSDSANQARFERIELEGREQFFQLRGKWSRWLLYWITGILLFQGMLTISVGIGALNFIEYKWFLPIVIGAKLFANYWNGLHHNKLFIPEG